MYIKMKFTATHIKFNWLKMISLLNKLLNKIL